MRKNLTEERTTISNPKNFDMAETLENHQPDYQEKIHQSLLNILKSVQEKKKSLLTEDRHRFLNTIELYCQEVLTNPSNAYSHDIRPRILTTSGQGFSRHPAKDSHGIRSVRPD